MTWVWGVKGFDKLVGRGREKLEKEIQR